MRLERGFGCCQAHQSVAGVLLVRTALNGIINTIIIDGIASALEVDS